jgi:hypothetical protein
VCVRWAIGSRPHLRSALQEEMDGFAGARWGLYPIATLARRLDDRYRGATGSSISKELK